jgi:hypothetical protein
MIKMPVFNTTDGDWEHKITLDAQEIIVRMRWNPRAGFWFMDLDDQQGHSLVGRKLIPLFPICYSHRALFPISGDFVLMPEQDPAPEYPTFMGLGTTHNLFWLDPDELAGWEASLGL